MVSTSVQTAVFASVRQLEVCVWRTVASLWMVLASIQMVLAFDLHFSSRLSFSCEYLIILAQRGKNRSGA